MTIELVYDADCPNAPAARVALRSACARAGLAPVWTEWERSDPGAPARVRRWGSPTVLVDGRDVAGDEGADAPTCRLYRDEEGRPCGAPPVAVVTAALMAHRPRR